jgi:hypothetical protein
MKIAYLPTNQNIASTRLRKIIPMREMRKLGVEFGIGDVFIAQKHGFSWDDLPKHQTLVFDVCDDHFNNHLSDHYRHGCAIADKVVCNSEVMREVIYTETGREATIIPEPYESPERTPMIGESLLWFGHASNLKDIQRCNFDYPLTILTNFTGYPEWTPERFAEEIAKPCIVVIPTGKSMAKSENRMVEAIRNGRYVCAEYLPAYEPFFNFFPCMDINEHIKRVLANPSASLSAIRRAQDYIHDRYSPETVAKQWMEAIQQ